MGTHPIFESDFDCLTDQEPDIMRYVAAYLLAQLGGNAAPSADDVKSILSSVGVDADEVRLNKVLSELSGKNVEEVIAEGKEKLASVPQVEPLPLEALPQLETPLPPRKKRRPSPPNPNLETTTWVSDSSIKSNKNLQK